MKRTTVLAALVLALCTTIPTLAQPTADTKTAVKELRTSMRTWFTRSVYPTLSTWKRTYDASLSAEDLATLNNLRAQASQLRTSMRTMSHDERRAAMHALAEQVKPIAMRSKQTLMQLFSGAKPQLETWRAEAGSIISSWKTAHPDVEARGGGLPLKGLLHDDRGGEHGGKRMAVRFLLWDGQLPSADMTSDPFVDHERIDATTSVQDESGIAGTALKLDPVPTQHTAAVHVSGLQDGPATIEIYDMNGTLQRSIATTVVNGTIDQSVDVSALTTGTYMASVNTSRGRRTTQLVVQR